jgi:hypothetical protein
LEPGTTKNNEGRVLPFFALPALADLMVRQRQRTSVVEQAHQAIVRYVFHRAGVSRSVAMKVTGHKTESVYKRYAIVSESDLSEGLAKLARLQPDAKEASPTVVPFKDAK